jgi:putative flavoprotein involved in K+ transport
MIEATPRNSHEVIVVGGGQAGLALGYHLAKRGKDFTILEARLSRPSRGGNGGTR